MIDFRWFVDEAQDADPVILGLVERHPGPRVMVGDSYQQLYQCLMPRIHCALKYFIGK